MRPEPRSAAAFARLLTTSALISAAGLVPPAFADSGTACLMMGQACVIATQGGPAAPASGDGGSGSSGNAGPGLTTTLDTPAAYQDDVIQAPGGALYYSPVTLSATGSKGANGNKGGSSTNFGQGGNGGQGGDGGDVTLTVSSPGGSGNTISGVSGSIASGLTVNSIAGAGGGGALGADHGGAMGTSSVGGTGGTVTVTAGGNFTSVAGRGADIWSNGGTGVGADGTLNKYGVDGAAGGDAGPVSVTLDGFFQGQTAGVHIASVGGSGGSGESSGSGQGGNGKDGGDGMGVNVTLSSAAQVHGYGNNEGGLWFQSLGGHAADWSFNPTSGDGNSGGTPGTVTGVGADIQTGVKTSDSDTAPGVLAQSIGGFGGIGPSPKDWFSVGGAGGNASSGKAVSAALTDAKIVTFGYSSSGIVAQSIGGGGGSGGDANGSGGVVNVVIGGTGGGGGGCLCREPRQWDDHHRGGSCLWRGHAVDRR